MKSKLVSTLLVLVFLLTSCLQMVTDGGVVLTPAIIPYAEIQLAIQSSPLAFPLILMAVGAETANESADAVINAGGCLYDPSQTASPEAGYVICNHLNEGEIEKIRSRYRAAQNADGKTPSKCFVREAREGTAESIALYFEGKYSGSRHSYIGSLYIRNITFPDRDTFVGIGKASQAKLDGFSEVMSDPRCQKALEYMNILIQNMKTSPNWPSP